MISCLQPSDFLDDSHIAVNGRRYPNHTSTCSATSTTQSSHSAWERAYVEPSERDNVGAMEADLVEMILRVAETFMPLRTRKRLRLEWGGDTQTKAVMEVATVEGRPQPWTYCEERYGVRIRSSDVCY